MPVRVFLAISTPFKLIIINFSIGFLGHPSSGHFDPSLALPLAVGAVLRGFAGTQFTVKIQPKKLKVIFGATSLLVAIIMVINAYPIIKKYLNLLFLLYPRFRHLYFRL